MNSVINLGVFRNRVDSMEVFYRDSGVDEIRRESSDGCARVLIMLVAVVLIQASVQCRAIAAEVGGASLDAYAVSNAELALLPSFCPHTQMFAGQYGSPAEYERWLAKVGEPFKAMHHYCIAMVALMRSDRAGVSAQQRSYLHNYAVSNFTYVLRHSTPDFVFLPEVLFRRGQAYKKSKELDRAVVDLRQAVEMRPDYVFAVSELADAYVQLGRSKDARAVLEKGLQSSPNSKFLKQSLNALR